MKGLQGLPEVLEDAAFTVSDVANKQTNKQDERPNPISLGEETCPAGACTSLLEPCAAAGSLL